MSYFYKWLCLTTQGSTYFIYVTKTSSLLSLKKSVQCTILVVAQLTVQQLSSDIRRRLRPSSTHSTNPYAHFSSHVLYYLTFFLSMQFFLSFVEMYLISDIKFESIFLDTIIYKGPRWLSKRQHLHVPITANIYKDPQFTIPLYWFNLSHTS